MTLGEGWVGLLATLAGAGSTLLMLHFLHRLQPIRGARPQRSTGRTGLAVACHGAGRRAVPWALFPGTGIGSLAGALAPAALWAAFWPVLLGTALFVGLRRWGHRLPHVPEGDIVVIVERAALAGAAWGERLERVENLLQRWPVAGMALLTLMVALGLALVGQGQ